MPQQRSAIRSKGWYREAWCRAMRSDDACSSPARVKYIRAAFVNLDCARRRNSAVSIAAATSVAEYRFRSRVISAIPIEGVANLNATVTTEPVEVTVKEFSHR